MKKLTFLIIAFTLVVSMAFVFAEIKSYCSSEVNVYLREGWNLVISPDYKSFYYNNMGILPNSEIQKEDIAEIGFFIFSSNKYIRVYSSQQNNLEISDLPSYIDLGIVPALVRSNKEGRFIYRTTNSPKKFDGISLLEGGNLITLSSGLEDKKLKDIQGNCNVLDIAELNADGTWANFNLATASSQNPYLPENWKFTDSVVLKSEEDVGKGIAFKVSGPCTLYVRPSWWAPLGRD